MHWDCSVKVSRELLFLRWTRHFGIFLCFYLTLHRAFSISTPSVCPALLPSSVQLSWRNARGSVLSVCSFWWKKQRHTSLTCLHLWHWEEVLAITSQDNCVCSQKQEGVWGPPLSCFWPPRQSYKPTRSAVMVFVLAWLPLALDADLYYPAGSRFITATLLFSTNFLFLFSLCLLSKITKESSRAEPLWWCNISQMSRDASQAHLPLEKKYWLLFPGLGGRKWNEMWVWLFYKWKRL